MTRDPAEGTEYILYLSRHALNSLAVSAIDTMPVVAGALRAYGSGAAQASETLEFAYRNGAGRFDARVAFNAETGDVALKTGGSAAGNNDRGLPQLSSVVVTFDPETARPVAILDGGWVTGIRTAAVSSLAADLLAVRPVVALGMIGAGVQARAQSLALCQVLQPDVLRVHDVSERAMSSFVTQMVSWEISCRVQPESSAEQVVRQSDVVVSATKVDPSASPSLRYEWLKPGALVLPLELDSAWDSATFSHADTFVTDDTAALYRIAGHGLLRGKVPAVAGELPSLLATGKKVRSSPDERIVAMNTGLAVADVAVASYTLDLARHRGLGVRLETYKCPAELYDF